MMRRRQAHQHHHQHHQQHHQQPLSFLSVLFLGTFMLLTLLSQPTLGFVLHTGGVAATGRRSTLPHIRRDNHIITPTTILNARAKAGGNGEEEGDNKPKKTTTPRTKKATTPASSSSDKSSTTSASSSSTKKPTKTKTTATKKKLPALSAFYDEALVDGSEASDVYQGDKIFNLMGESEDVIAPWSVDGFEIDIPDWRPQPAAKYEIVDPKVQEQLGKIENMFGASLRLVSTYEGVWRFLYMGNIKNLIGAEAWTKLLLVEDLGIEGVKEVRFETNYVRDYPDDWN